MFNEMDLYRARKMIQELAKSEGIAEEEMRMEMEKAIETGFSNQDPTVKKIWRASPFRDNRPSLEEFILWCASQL